MYKEDYKRLTHPNAKRPKRPKRPNRPNRPAKMAELMEIRVTAEKLYNDLDNTITSLVFAKNKGNAEKISACQNKIEEIFQTVYDSSVEVIECFFKLTIAEYKEKIYWSIFDCEFEKIDADILDEYDNIFESDDDLYDMLYNHTHDPTHYMFDLKNPFYMFHEMVEKNGEFILDLRDDDESFDDDDEDDADDDEDEDDVKTE